MNRVRRRTLDREERLRKDSGISVGEDERRETREAVFKEMEMEGPNAFGSGPNAARRTSDTRHSILPSPLGLSNYDALDDEDDWYGNTYDDDEETPDTGSERREKTLHREDKQGYYSDFNFFDERPDRQDEDENDYDDPFSLSLLPSEITKEKRPPSPPDDRLIELMKEKQRQREVAFLNFG